MKQFEQPVLFFEFYALRDILTVSEETEEPTGHSDFVTPPDEFEDGNS